MKFGSIDGAESCYCRLVNRLQWIGTITGKQAIELIGGYISLSVDDSLPDLL